MGNKNQLKHTWWFRKLGVPWGTPKWMVYNGQSHLEMDDDSGYPHFGKAHGQPSQVALTTLCLLKGIAAIVRTGAARLRARRVAFSRRFAVAGEVMATTALGWLVLPSWLSLYLGYDIAHYDIIIYIYIHTYMHNGFTCIELIGLQEHSSAHNRWFNFTYQHWDRLDRTPSNLNHDFNGLRKHMNPCEAIAIVLTCHSLQKCGLSCQFNCNQFRDCWDWFGWYHCDFDCGRYPKPHGISCCAQSMLTSIQEYSCSSNILLENAATPWFQRMMKCLEWWRVFSFPFPRLNGKFVGTRVHLIFGQTQIWWDVQVMFIPKMSPACSQPALGDHKIRGFRSSSYQPTNIKK